MVCQGVSLSLVMLAGQTGLGMVLDLPRALENDCPPHYPVSLSCKVSDLPGLYLRLGKWCRCASWAQVGALGALCSKKKLQEGGGVGELGTVACAWCAGWKKACAMT